MAAGISKPEMATLLVRYSFLHWLNLPLASKISRAAGSAVKAQASTLRLALGRYYPEEWLRRIPLIQVVESRSLLWRVLLEAICSRV